MFNTANRKRPFKQVVGAKKSASSAANNANDGGSTTSSIKERKASTPPTTIVINGIDVHFPFRPYDVQMDYMKSVVTALQNRQHALLESPTGTGKTLCLLCSALAWQHREKGKLRMKKDDPQLSSFTQQPLSQQQPPLQSQPGGSQIGQNNNNDDNATPTTSSSHNNKPPVIIYASRTHSQLTQVVGELRNTRYRPRHAVLGSREHMCIHPKVNPTLAKGKNGALSSDAGCRSSSDVNNGCNKLNKERKCLFRNNLEDQSGKSVWKPPSNEQVAATGDNKDYEQPVLDIEELVSVAKDYKVCPFYHTRSLIKDAELIFVPYNYLFDRDARERTLQDVNFDNAILIFDEAHNLEEFASESSSFDLSSSDLAGCVGEVTRALQYLELNPEIGGDGSGHNMKDNMLRLKSILLRFESYLLDEITQARTGAKMSSEGEASYPGEAIFDIYEKGAGIIHGNLHLLIDFVKKVSDVIMEFKGNAASSGTPKLDHFVHCLKRAFGPGTGQGKELLALARAKSYRVHVSKRSTGNGGFDSGRTISFWCFAPALAMRELSFLKVRSILITSGTLSPLPSFSMELGLNFPVQLENNHVIQPDQIFVRVVGKGVSGKELSSKYERRDDPEYISELGMTLASLCRNIPGGVLVFFPSYGAMETAIQRWGGPASERFGGRQSGGGRGAAFFAAKRKKNMMQKKYVFPMVPASFRASTNENTPWQRLLARKAIVLEPRSTADLSDVISEFKKFIATPKSTGALLMGVCRGKLAEGIDFSDDMCRAVVLTGLPFAPYLDPKVKLKREFLDAARATSKSQARPSVDGGFGNGKLPQKVEAPATNSNNLLSGAVWYNQQAHRAVNQAIGRVIRHRHDFGAILLLDHRFAEARNKDGLSKWLRPHLLDESFGLTNKGLIQFYKESKAKAEKSKASLIQELTDKEPLDRRTIKKEDSAEVRKVSVISEKGLADDDALMNSGYVQPNRVMKRYDLNDQAARASSKIAGENYGMNVNDDDNTAPHSTLPAAAGLGAFYSKEKPQLKPPPPSSASVETKLSSFGGIGGTPKTGNSTRFAKKDMVKRRPQPSRKISDGAKLQAKIFFDKAQLSLSKEKIQEVNKLILAMKGYGESRSDQQYMKSAKELLLVLLESQVDSKRIQLIRSLFPLLPNKHRYKIEKMAAILAFDKSPLRRVCADALSEQELTAVKGFVLSTIFNENSSHESVAFADRAFLEDSEKILAVLVKHNVNLQQFFDILPERQLRKVRTLALEMKKRQEVEKAKERSSNFKGEDCVNPVLFRRAEQKQMKAEPKHSTANVTQSSENPADDAETQQNLTHALSQAMSVNRQKKDRVVEFQSKKEAKLKAKPFNPYQRPKKLKESTNKRNLPSMAVGNNSHAATAKRLCKGTSAASQGSKSRPSDSMDMVDRCLQQVKSDGFVQPKSRLEKINGKIKAHVPKGMVCIVCSETPKEPLMAECNHSACFSCWKSWLKRQNTCPTCRAPTQMKDLAKLVFAKDTGVGAPTLTQICASDDEEEDESDDEELEIIAN